MASNNMNFFIILQTTYDFVWKWENFLYYPLCNLKQPSWRSYSIYLILHWNIQWLKSFLFTCQWIDEFGGNCVSSDDKNNIERFLVCEIRDICTQNICSQVNYSRLIHELDDELKDDLGSGRHLPRIVDKTLRLLNLKQVVSELETSVMSKVSCTACKAGKYVLDFGVGSLTRLVMKEMQCNWARELEFFEISCFWLIRFPY